MTPITKKTIVTFLFSGLIYGGLSAIFDYSDGVAFSFWKFIIKASFFGFFMALMFQYNEKKENKVSNDNK
jgi:NADH:ubiquinone oxidoreductase subunit H